MNIVNYVLSYPPHYDLSFPKFDLPHPSRTGFVLRLGEQKGQIADYGLSITDGRGIHVLEYQDRYLVHWDEVDALTNPIGHIVRDAPQYAPILWLLSLGAVVFGLSLFPMD